MKLRLVREKDWKSRGYDDVNLKCIQLDFESVGFCRGVTSSEESQRIGNWRTIVSESHPLHGCFVPNEEAKKALYYPSINAAWGALKKLSREEILSLYWRTQFDSYIDNNAEILEEMEK